jgi:dihydroxy-acid dehydratase
MQAVSDKIPFIADLKPSGKYVMEDLHRVGGTPAVIKLLLREGLLHGDCLTGMESAHIGSVPAHVCWLGVCT